MHILLIIAMTIFSTPNQGWCEETIPEGKLPLGKGMKGKMHIIKAQLGSEISCPNNAGDLWTSTWAEDDYIYSVSDDSSGFNRPWDCATNLVVNRLTGMPPNIKGETINPMNEFGATIHPTDGAGWKASGLTSVDGVLYLSVSRHRYPVYDGTGNNIQQSWDATIIKSTDHGKTWSAAPKELGGQFEQVMFPGPIFSNPFFVQYGKDGKGTADDSDKFVYAVSNDGSWNNGNFMTMGRVRRDRIGRLDSKDWEFINGFDNCNPTWAPRYDSAIRIFRSPGHTSMTGIHYIEPLGLYIMPQWYYLRTNVLHEESRLDFYQARKPWGPWKLFHSQEYKLGWYNPCIPSKFISSDGRKMWIFVSSCHELNVEHGGTQEGPDHYHLHMIPMNLDIEVENYAEKGEEQTPLADELQKRGVRLLMLCGRPYKEVVFSEQGYQATITGDVCSDWNPPFYHCRSSSYDIHMELTVPKRSKGTVRMYIDDQDQQKREEEIIVGGESLGTFKNFEKGKWIEHSVNGKTTENGKVLIQISNKNKATNAVISILEWIETK